MGLSSYTNPLLHLFSNGIVFPHVFLSLPSWHFWCFHKMPSITLHLTFFLIFPIDGLASARLWLKFSTKYDASWHFLKLPDNDSALCWQKQFLSKWYSIRASASVCTRSWQGIPEWEACSLLWALLQNVGVFFHDRTYFTVCPTYLLASFYAKAYQGYSVRFWNTLSVLLH